MKIALVSRLHQEIHNGKPNGVRETYHLQAKLRRFRVGEGPV
jgi:hypothetical protein